MEHLDRDTSIEKLLKERFHCFDSVETNSALYLTPVKSVGSDAYLNIVFKPLSGEVVQKAASEWKIPSDFLQFLKINNGARLFFDAFCVYGIVDEELIDRRNSFAFRPFSIADAVNEFENGPNWNRDLFPIGWYNSDGSQALLRISDGSVHWTTNRQKTPSVQWPSIAVWVREEIERISRLYSADGILKFDQKLTLPAVYRS